MTPSAKLRLIATLCAILLGQGFNRSCRDDHNLELEQDYLLH